MAGKKGRSGRKPIHGVTELKKAEKILKPDGVETSTSFSIKPKGALSVDIETPKADPFKAIEAQLENEFPQPQAEGSKIVQAGEDKQPPERIIRLAWGWIYKVEDNVLRSSLGLGAEYKGIFCDEKLIEAHVSPTCEVVKQYVPQEYWADLDKKFPIAALIAAVGECQLSIFDKIGEIKRELKQNTAQNLPNAPQSRPIPGNDPYRDFPRPGA